MRKKIILSGIAFIAIFFTTISTLMAQTIGFDQVVFDLTKSGQVAKLHSDATVNHSSSEGMIFSTRSRRATFQSESIKVPLDKVEPFLAVGLNMEHSDYENEFTVYIRNSKDNVNWSDWIVMEQIDLIEKELDKYRGEIVFMDKDVKYVQYMVAMRKTNQGYPSLKNISLSFISPGLTPKGSVEKSLFETKAMAEKQEIDPTTKAYPRPSYVNRKGWGCPHAENTTARSLTTVTHLVVHHSGGETYSSDFAAIVRSYWKHHVYTNKWADIGYNWLVDRNGVVYKGRAWYSSTKENVMGAHNSGKNGGTVGICMIGGFTSGRLPSTNQWNSTYKILAFLCNKYGLNPKGSAYHKSIGRTNDIIDGHGQSGGGTTCPGDISKYYSTIRNSVANLLSGSSGSSGPSSLSASIASCPSNDVTFKWTNKGTGWQIHVSTSSSFSSYYLKWVSGLTSYKGPTGFVGKSDNKAMPGFTPGTKYYWRIYYNGKYTSTKSFTMHTCPPANLSATQVGCPNDDVTFKWTNSGTGWQIHVSTSSNFSSYYLKWVSGKTSYTGPLGFVHNSTNAAMPEFKDGTKYYWRMKYTDGYTATKSFTTHTCAKPVANFAMSSSKICTGESVNMTNSSQNATSYSWSFTGGSPATSTAKNPSVTYSTPGTYSVKLTVTNAAGSSSKTSEITINSAPQASFSTSVSSALPNQSIKLTNSSQNATSYSWSFSGGTPSTSTDENPTVAYSSTGEYTITLTAKNANCQDVEEKKNVVTIANPISVLDDFEVDKGHFNHYPTYSGITTGISSSSTQLRTTSTSYGGNGSLEAKMIDNTSSSGDWIVRLLSGTGRPSDNTPIASKGTVKFWMKTSTANNGAVVQIWVDDNDGLEASPYVTVANDGKWHQYSFDLEEFGGTTITTGNGKLDASEVTLDAIVLAQSNTSSTWTVYIDDVVHDIGGSGTFLKELEGGAVSNEFIEEELSEVRVYPNPNNGTFRINFSDTEIQGFDVNIFNTSGTLVHSTQAFSNQFDLNVQDLPDGMYFVNVKNNDFNKTISIMIAK